MEAHHHAHHPAGHKKKWTDFLFEFLMLFLAVFAGFIAENLREHAVEREREHQFIESMVEDLKSDTTMIGKVYQMNEKQVKGQDSLLQLLYNYPATNDSLRKMYLFYYKYALIYEPVIFTDRTLTQLKNSGSLRLIRNQRVSDSIMTYDAGIKACDGQLQALKEFLQEETNFSYSIFKMQYSAQPKIFSGPAPLELLTTDKKTIAEFTNRLLGLKYVVMGYAMTIKYQQQAAIRLLKFLKAQYHIE